MKALARPSLALVVLCCCSAAAPAWGPVRTPPLAGRLVDYTHRRQRDDRFWSPALAQFRDLYVYLPPGYDASCRYPVMIWLHGIAEDEKAFVENSLGCFDAAMAAGTLPPMIIAIPDGSLYQRAALLGPRPFFANSNLGCFEDYIVVDLWSFLNCRYSLRPEREAHVIAGSSGGGGAAYRIALKHPEIFGVVFAISPPLNLRWVDCKGRYFGNFDPNCWGWRDEYHAHDVVGRFYGVITIRMRDLAKPLFGRGGSVIEGLSRDNPIELLDRCGVQPGMYQMFVAYGGRDEFNIDAQVESFLYVARCRGLQVETAYDPRGRHQQMTLVHFFGCVHNWLGPRLEPYRAPLR